MPNFKFRFVLGLAAVLILSNLILLKQSAFAQPAQSDYKKLGNGNNASAVLTNCPLVEGVTKVKITNGGKSVSVFTLKNRDDYNFGKKYKYFACQADGVIYAKDAVGDAPVTFDLSLSDFPKAENNVGSACGTVRSWPGSHIYKTVGSHHFTDIRRNTIGLILKYGASGPFPSCISVVDTKGKEVAKMGLYAKGAGWAARYYAGVGCGGGTPFNGSSVANKAKSNTGSTKIYMDFGSTCLGPIDANQCIGSQQC